MHATHVNIIIIIFIFASSRNSSLPHKHMFMTLHCLPIFALLSGLCFTRKFHQTNNRGRRETHAFVYCASDNGISSGDFAVRQQIKCRIIMSLSLAFESNIFVGLRSHICVFLHFVLLIAFLLSHRRRYNNRWHRSQWFFLVVIISWHGKLFSLLFTLRFECVAKKIERTDVLARVCHEL